MQIKKYIDKISDKFTGGTHNNYYSNLSNESFIQKILYKYFLRKIKFNYEKINKLQESIKNNKEDTIIVYSTKFRRNFDYILYNSNFKNNGYPEPTIGLNFSIYLFHPLKRFFRITFSKIDYFLRNFSKSNPFQNGFYKQEMFGGKSMILPLIVKNSFYDRFVKSKTDPVKFLIDIQKITDKTIYIVPQLIFYSKTPSSQESVISDFLFGTRENPGTFRRIFTMLINPSSVFVESDDPINLKEYLEKESIKNLSDKRKAEILRSELVQNLNIHRQSITGPVIKSRDEQREIILTSERLSKYFDEYSIDKKIPINKVYKKANKHFDEISTKYNFTVAKFLLIFVNFLINKIFDGVTYNLDGLLKIREMSKKGPVIFIPCHKSHIDYLVLPYVLMGNNFPNPHALAGKNLFFFPVNKFLKAVGAISIRRTFKNSPLYSAIFAEYINQLLSEGFNIENFIEGGRTRSGKILAPKLGFISIVLNAFKNNACKDINFAPVFISYDRVVEEKAYLKEIDGGTKTKESLSEFVKAGKVLKKRFGKIYLKFGDGISLNEFIESSGLSPDNDSNVVCEELGNRIIDSLNKNSIVTPHSIIASALLNSSRKWVSNETIFETIDMFLNYLKFHNAELAATIKTNHKVVFEGVLDTFVSRKFIDIKDENEFDRSYKVLENKRVILDFYRNNNIIFFIPAAYVSASILNHDNVNLKTEDLINEYNYLKSLFSIEFTFMNMETIDKEIRKVIKSFIDDGLLEPDMKEPDKYQITTKGYKTIKFYSAFLKCYFESYFVVIKYILKNTGKDDFRKKVKKAHILSLKMYENKEIELKESISKINIKNGVIFMDRLKEEEINIHKMKIKKYLSLI
ncbi:MAG: hypothetical protein GY760_08955 [Deltaproteobacteria bacterium]|nr:hypothetical protein [Deltaproteobacteria bacterium]